MEKDSPGRPTKLRPQSRAKAIPWVLFFLVMMTVRRGAAADGGDAKLVFNRRCTACHTFGKGVKVGPDLKGVTLRRPRAWLLSFIRSSQSMINSGDGVARSL